ncbi:hypothetical protein E2C01_039531 [Portunus trituberculatus]|uniref:Uncharacterized protein n=1 Tax=Portunus trituberculatus TaxID=210409 RepID=A0A5B7FJZ0_PORTR|nr:hypothetical protein [Portunus trituberculatus]
MCQLCDMGEDETVECEKYERDRQEMMQVILSELGAANTKAWLFQSDPEKPVTSRSKSNIKIKI